VKIKDDELLVVKKIAKDEVMTVRNTKDTEIEKLDSEIFKLKTQLESGKKIRNYEGDEIDLMFEMNTKEKELENLRSQIARHQNDLSNLNNKVELLQSQLSEDPVEKIIRGTEKDAVYKHILHKYINETGKLTEDLESLRQCYFDYLLVIHKKKEEHPELLKKLITEHVKYEHWPGFVSLIS